VRASANGSFTSNVKVTTANDGNPANDTQDVAVEISGANVAANNGSATSGGGGRVEWLLLLFLALVKWGHSPFAGKKGQASQGR
jgi:hypothetical protein